MSRNSLDQAQAVAALVASLHARRQELEQQILTRIFEIGDPSAVLDQRYREGLRTAVSVALDYAFLAIGPGRCMSVPPELLFQARLAACNGVNLDTVLRRYAAGYALIGDLIIDEVQAAGAATSDLKRMLRSQAVAFDRLLASVSEEYARATSTRLPTGERRRAELIESLLAGELLDTSELGYDFDVWHLGLVAAGPDAPEMARDLAALLDRRLLLSMSVDRELTWGWLGGRRAFDGEEVATFDDLPGLREVCLAVGEPGRGLAGWRLTHRQAAATFPIALRVECSIAHYAEAPLLASALNDELLATSLRRLYLEPLEDERDGGEEMRRTLRAYFEASGNVSSAAAALDVSRTTVHHRLAVVEDRLGRPIDAVSAEVETALRLDEIGASESSWCR